MARRPGLATARGEATPGPIEHAAPDVELADAQLAVGRSEPLEDSAEADLELGAEDNGEVDAFEGRLPVARPGVATRLSGFIQGSWRELQRVQWPDRRQVAQATGVVIGFVIVAGVFLGAADLVAQKLMNFILK